MTGNHHYGISMGVIVWIGETVKVLEMLFDHCVWMD